MLLVSLAGAALLAVLVAGIVLWRSPSAPVRWGLGDGGFEQQTRSTISSPWAGEGTGGKGVDIGLNFAHTGRNNAWIRTADTNWNAVTQRVQVEPNTHYRLQGWVRTSANLHYQGSFGVRPGGGNSSLAEISYGADSAGSYQPLTIDFDSGNNHSLTVFIGYTAPGEDSFIQIDDFSLSRAS